MKSTLKICLTVSALVLTFTLTGPAFAQDQSQSDGDKPGMKMLSSLSAEDKAKFLKARHQVMENNPDLKTEGEDLMKQRQALKDQGTEASPEDRQEMMQKFMAYQQKLKAAMLQVDPSLQPVFDQIDQQMKERFQKRAESQGAGT